MTPEEQAKMLAEALEAFVTITKNPAPRADDRKMQWISVMMKAQTTLATYNAERLK